MKKITAFLILMLGAVLLSAKSCPAAEAKTKSLVAVEVLSGFSWGKLHAKDNYNFIPLNVAFDFDLKPLTKKINFEPPSLLQFQIEPYLGFILSPESNFETGTTFWLKAGLVPESWKLQPYAKLGAGITYMTLHTREQGTQFNFTEQAGIGIHYSLTRNSALTLEGRWRHLSNSGIKDPNHGINSYSVVSGIAYKF